MVRYAKMAENNNQLDKAFELYKELNDLENTTRIQAILRKKHLDKTIRGCKETRKIRRRLGRCNYYL